MVHIVDTILEPLLASPQLPRHVEELQHILAEEAKRRRRFYEEMNENQKTEFINGVVVVHSPAKWRHMEASENLYFLLTTYVRPRHLGKVRHEKLLVALSRNDYEPDVCFFDWATAATFTSTQMTFPAPNFVAEVLSPSTVGTDRRIKKQDYASHGIAEYWIIDPDRKTIEQLVLAGTDYELAGVWSGGEIVKSIAIKGFEIPAEALFDDEASLAAKAAFDGRV